MITTIESPGLSKSAIDAPQHSFVKLPNVERVYYNTRYFEDKDPSIMYNQLRTRTTHRPESYWFMQGGVDPVPVTFFEQLLSVAGSEDYALRLMQEYFRTYFGILSAHEPKPEKGLYQTWKDNGLKDEFLEITSHNRNFPVFRCIESFGRPFVLCHIYKQVYFDSIHSSCHEAYVKGLNKGYEFKQLIPIEKPEPLSLNPKLMANLQARALQEGRTLNNLIETALTLFVDGGPITHPKA